MPENEREIRRASIDPERLLPGENPEHPQPGDAEHWVSVYSELLETKRRLIANLREMMERQPAGVQDELERADIRMLELQIERFKQRLQIWRGLLKRESDQSAG